jgi:hypothetical protein
MVMGDGRDGTGGRGCSAVCDVHMMRAAVMQTQTQTRGFFDSGFRLPGAGDFPLHRM